MTHGFDMIQNANPTHTVAVDCSSRYLSFLPENLPENTVLLNVTNNNVRIVLFSKKMYIIFKYIFSPLCIHSFLFRLLLLKH